MTAQEVQCLLNDSSRTRENQIAGAQGDRRSEDNRDSKRTHTHIQIRPSLSDIIFFGSVSILVIFVGPENRRARRSHGA